MTEQLAIVAENIQKDFKHNKILRGVSLIVPQGKIYGITGHNGSGKSIFLRIIAGLVKPSAGQLVVWGKKLGEEIEFAPHTGFLIDGPGFLPDYSALENLKLLALIRNQITENDIRATLQRVGLDPNNSKPVKTFSSGMKQRLGLAQCLMESPTLMLLDEPTNALDKEGRQQLYSLLKECREEGKTILMTTHYGEDLKTLCDATFVMDAGQLSPSP